MTRTDRTPRRRLDPAERRADILDAATLAFRAAPYPDVAVADVAAAADSSEALVHKYFGGKADLYAEVLRAGIDGFVARQASALAALPDGVPIRDRVRAVTLAHLDEIATAPAGWASAAHRPAGEPETAEAVRAAAREADVARLRAILQPSTTIRHDYALTAWFGFLDEAGRRWADQGCRADDRWSIVDAALGALEGALGDWAA